MPEKVSKSRKVERGDENLTEDYQFTGEGNENVIMDIPTSPIKKHDTVRSNKELYESYVKDLKKYSLVLNGEVIYDSSIDKSKEAPLKFENDYFMLYGKKYSYNGLRIQKLNGK